MHLQPTPLVRRVRAFGSVTCALALLAAGGCSSKASGEGKAKAAAAPAPLAPVAVELASVTEAPMPQVLVVSGSLTANEDSDVAAGVAGKVLATFVERGDTVKKGAVLARLDARVAAAAAREASAQLDTIRAQREQAKSDCTRAQQLFDKGAMTRVEFEKAQTACRTAESSASAAEARALSTSTVLADSTIRAPFAGMVVERSVSAGEYVRADSKVVSLVQVDPLRLQLTVPEAQANRIAPGMEVSFRTPADAPGALHKAKVRFVGPALRRETRDLVVEALVDNADRKLRPGNFVTARLALAEAPMPVVPRAAIRTEAGASRVFVASDGRVADRLVQLGEPKGDQIAIVTGVRAGEQVVVTPPPALRDGTAIAAKASN